MKIKKMPFSWVLIIAWFLIMFGCIAGLAMMLHSCSTVQKSTEKTITKTDSAHVTTSNKNRWQDSAGTIRKQQQEKWKKKTTIKYAEVDTNKSFTYPAFGTDQEPTRIYRPVPGTKTYGPVEVTITESGTKQKTSEQSVSKHEGAAENVADSAHLKKQESTTVKTKKKISFSFLWLLALLIIPAFIYRSKLLTFFKHQITRW